MVIYDACVLFPATLRNLLMQLAADGLVRARWTHRIHDEWITSLLAHRPDLRRENLMRTRGLMDAAVPECIVTGYEPLIGGVILPDPADRHVLAAAIQCRADGIVTRNLRDFPVSALAPHGIEVLAPDAFVVRLLVSDPDAVCRAIKALRRRLLNPRYSAGELLDVLERQGLPMTVARLASRVQSI